MDISYCSIISIKECTSYLDYLDSRLLCLSHSRNWASLVKRRRESSLFMQPSYFMDSSRKLPHPVFCCFFFSIPVIPMVHRKMTGFLFQLQIFSFKNIFQNTWLVWWCPFCNYYVILTAMCLLFQRRLLSVFRFYQMKLHEILPHSSEITISRTFFVS